MKYEQKTFQYVIGQQQNYEIKLVVNQVACLEGVETGGRREEEGKCHERFKSRKTQQ